MDLAGRQFQVWDYSPSLSRLLIRSPRKDKTELNIDIIFWGVKHLNVMTSLTELSVEVGEQQDNNYQLFILRSNEGVFTIEAVNYKISTSDTDRFESPLNRL